MEIVRILSSHKRNVEFFPETDDLIAYLGDSWHAGMIHNFQKIIFGAEYFLMLFDDPPRFCGVFLAKRFCKLAAKTSGEADQPFGIFSEDFFIHARLVVVPFKVRERDELDE